MAAPVVSTFYSKSNNAQSLASSGSLNNTTTPVTFSVTSTQGARFPSGNFFITVWNAVSFPNPVDDPNMEIMLCTARTTDSLTCTRGQQGTTNVAHTGTPAVRLLIIKQHWDDVETGITGIQNPGGLYLPFGGTNVTGLSYPRAAQNNASSGNVDLYTCPAGKRAWIGGISAYNTTGSSITAIPKIKISSTYYQIGSSSTLNANIDTLVDFFWGVFIEAGDKATVNLSASGANVWARVVEFDNTAPMKMERLVDPATGQHTVYTVPSGKTAVLTDGVIGINGGYWSGSIRAANFTGNNGDYQIYVVNSGGSAGSSNQLSSYNLNTGSTAYLGHYMTLNTGDFIVVQSNFTGTGQIYMFMVLEV